MSSLNLPHLWLICWSIWEPIKLHYLSSFTSYRIIAKSLPLEADFGESIFNIWISLHLSFFIRDMIQLNTDVSAVHCLPYMLDDLFYSFLKLSYIQSAYMSNKCAIFSNCCVIHIEDSNTLCFFWACCSQLNVVALIALCLLRLQDFIIIKGQSLSWFNLCCEISLHKRPETLFIYIKWLKNEFIERSCLMYFTWRCMLLIIAQLLCYLLLNCFTIWWWCWIIIILWTSIWLLYRYQILFAW